MDYGRYKSLRIEIRDRIALVTLNRPEILNSFDTELHFNLEDALGDLQLDPEVDAAVLTGAGRMFSAGGDIKDMKARLDDPTLPSVPLFGPIRLLNNLVNLDKPIIAAVNGDAIGLGATVALFCDVIFASEEARFCDPHVRVGLVAGDGGCIIWPLLIGMARAKQYLLTGDAVDAKEAERIGLINKAVPAGQVLLEATAFAQRLATGATQAIRWTKMSLNQTLKSQLNLILPTSTATEFLCFQSADYSEAVNAFVEKRQPHFTGR